MNVSITQLTMNIVTLQTERSEAMKSLEWKVKEFTKSQRYLTELNEKWTKSVSELTRITKENSKLTTEMTKIRNNTITLETKISESESKLKQNAIEGNSNKGIEKYSKAATVEIGKLKDMVKKLETSNAKLLAEIKRLKEDNAIKPDKIKTLVDSGLKSATQKLQTALDTMTAERTKLQEEKKFKHTAQEEVFKNEASTWRTKYTIQYEENRRLRGELKNELGAFRVMEASKKEAKTNVLKAIGGGGLLAGLLSSPIKTGSEKAGGGGLLGGLMGSPIKTGSEKAGGGGLLGGLMGSPIKTGSRQVGLFGSPTHTEESKKSPTGLSKELGVVEFGAFEKIIAADSSPTLIEQTETVVTKVEEEKTKKNPGIELWMESEDEKPDVFAADDQSEQEIERMYEIIEKKNQTQVGPLDVDSPITDNDMQTLGFNQVQKTLTSSAMFVDEKDQNITTTSVVTEQKSSFNNTTVQNTETTETRNIKETITDQKVFVDESVYELEEVTTTTDIRYEGTTKIETITTTTTTTDEKTGEVLDTRVNIEEIITENYDEESETFTESCDATPKPARKDSQDSEEFMQVDYSKKTTSEVQTPGHTGQSTPINAAGPKKGKRNSADLTEAGNKVGPNTFGKSGGSNNNIFAG